MTKTRRGRTAVIGAMLMIMVAAVLATTAAKDVNDDYWMSWLDDTPHDDTVETFDPDDWTISEITEVACMADKGYAAYQDVLVDEAPHEHFAGMWIELPDGVERTHDNAVAADAAYVECMKAADAAYDALPLEEQVKVDLTEQSEFADLDWDEVRAMDTGDGCMLRRAPEFTGDEASSDLYDVCGGYDYSTWTAPRRAH